MILPAVLPSDWPRRRPTIAPTVPHRLLTCHECEQPEYLIEPQGPATDPAVYRCSSCLLKGVAW